MVDVTFKKIRLDSEHQDRTLRDKLHKRQYDLLAIPESSTGSRVSSTFRGAGAGGEGGGVLGTLLQSILIANLSPLLSPFNAAWNTRP
jgi:hypothetical protein